MMSEQHVYNFFAFIFGAIIGSFLNVLIHRMPLEEEFVFRSSHCPLCNKDIRWYENIPIVSFVFLRGKCSSCHGKISWRYPVVELLTALASLFLLPSNFSSQSIAFFFAYLTIFSIFLVHFLIDLKHQILPNSLNVILSLLFFAMVVLEKDWTFWASGALLGAGFPLLIVWIFYLIRGQVGLGGGDIKLFGALGLYLGPIAIIQNIFLSCMLGSVVGVSLILLKKMNKDNPIPFGPFIIIVSFVQIFFPSIMKMILPY